MLRSSKSRPRTTPREFYPLALGKSENAPLTQFSFTSYLPRPFGKTNERISLLYPSARYFILLSTILFALLLGCRKKDPFPANREVVSNLYIQASDLPEVIKCDQPFEYKKVKFMVRKPLDNEIVDNSSSWPPLCRTQTNRRDFPAVILESTTALEIDLSSYKGFKTIEIEAAWINGFDRKSSQIKVFDFKNELLEKQDIPDTRDYYPKLSFENRSDNVKKIVIVGYAEVTSFNSIALRAN